MIPRANQANVKRAKANLDADLAKTPFGVLVSMGTWAGAPQIAAFGINIYLLCRAFPEIVGPEYAIAALDYILGRHPVHNLSLGTGLKNSQANLPPRVALSRAAPTCSAPRRRE